MNDQTLLVKINGRSPKRLMNSFLRICWVSSNANPFHNEFIEVINDEHRRNHRIPGMLLLRQDRFAMDGRRVRRYPGV